MNLLQVTLISLLGYLTYIPVSYTHLLACTLTVKRRAAGFNV